MKYGYTSVEPNGDEPNGDVDCFDLCFLESHREFVTYNTIAS